MGIRCSHYIDDFFFAVRGVDESLRVRLQVLDDFTALGWFIGDGKCLLKTGTLVKYFGVFICSLPVPHARMPDAKI